MLQPLTSTNSLYIWLLYVYISELLYNKNMHNESQLKHEQNQHTVCVYKKDPKQVMETLCKQNDSVNTRNT